MLNERLSGLPFSEVRTQILHHLEAVQQETGRRLALAENRREALT